MSEATKDTQDSTDLDARAAALKEAVVAPPAASPPPAAEAAEEAGRLDFEALAAEAVNLLVSATPSETPKAGSAAAQPQSIDDALTAAAADLANTAEPAAATVAPAGESQDLAKAVERLIQETPAPTPAAPEVAATPKKIEALDAQIADLADNLIAGEFADEQNVLQGQVGEPPHKETPPPPLGSEPPAAPAKPATEPAKAQEPPTFAAPASQPTPPEPRPATALPTPSAPSAPAKSSKSAKAAAKVAARHGANAAGLLKPLGNKLLVLICSPLAGKPKYTRDLIGWLALWTMFVSLTLWGYILFFRSASPPAAVKEVAAATHGEAKAPAKSEHGEKKEAKSEHGEKKDSKPEKKPPAKKEAPKKGAAKSGGH